MSNKLEKTDVKKLTKYLKMLSPIANKKSARILPVLGAYRLKDNKILVWNGAQGCMVECYHNLDLCVDADSFSKLISTVNNDITFIPSEDKKSVGLKFGKTKINFNTYDPESFIFNENLETTSDVSLLITKELLFGIKKCLMLAEEDNIYSMKGVFFNFPDTKTSVDLLSTNNVLISNYHYKMPNKEILSWNTEKHSSLCVLLPAVFCKQLLTFCEHIGSKEIDGVEIFGSLEISPTFVSAVFSDKTFLFSSVETDENESAEFYTTLEDVLQKKEKCWFTISDEFIKTINIGNVLSEKDKKITLIKKNETITVNIDGTSGNLVEEIPIDTSSEKDDTLKNMKYEGDLKALEKAFSILSITDKNTKAALALVKQHPSSPESLLEFFGSENVENLSESNYFLTVLVSSL